MADNIDNNSNVDIQAEIEKARKQERDKLYPEIQKLKDEVQKWKDEVANKVKDANGNFLKINELEKTIKAKEKELSDLNEKITKAKDEGKMEATAGIENLKKELEDYKAKLAKSEKDFADYKNAEELKAYRESKLSDIDDDFKNLVKGSTKEEIDASYTEIKALQDSVKEKYGKNREPLPKPPKQGKRQMPTSINDLVSKLNSMSDEEYREARRFKR